MQESENEIDQLMVPMKVNIFLQVSQKSLSSQIEREILLDEIVIKMEEELKRVTNEIEEFKKGNLVSASATQLKDIQAREGQKGL